MVSKPLKRVAPPFRFHSSAHRAAPSAPASPEYRCTTISASGTFLPNEVYLRLHDRKIPVRAALEHEPAAGRCHVLKLAGIDPHVDRQHRGERGHDLVGRPALALLIDDVGLKKHTASHGETRHRPGGERPVGVFVERDAIPLRDALQKRAVARRTLRVQPEIGDGPLPKDHDLDVTAADVADDVRVGIEMQRRGRVRDRFDNGDVGAERCRRADPCRSRSPRARRRW